MRIISTKFFIIYLKVQKKIFLNREQENFRSENNQKPKPTQLQFFTESGMDKFNPKSSFNTRLLAIRFITKGLQCFKDDSLIIHFENN